MRADAPLCTVESEGVFKWPIERTRVSAGYIAPVVCTPEQLMEEL